MITEPDAPRPTLQESHAFFDQLNIYSRRLLQSLQLNGRGSPWGGTDWAHTNPRIRGVVLHFTADPDMRRVLRWFCASHHAANVSAHLVVGETAYPWAHAFDFDLPLVQHLPVTVVACRSLSQTAWHATWCNRTHYGIENVNVGEVRLTKWGWAWRGPRTDGSADYASTVVSERKPVVPPYRTDGRAWLRYTDAQIRANVMILKHLANISPGVTSGSVVTHEMVQGLHTEGGGGHDKRDCGAHFPLSEIRESVFAGTRIRERRLDWPLSVASDFWADLHPGSARMRGSDALARLLDWEDAGCGPLDQARLHRRQAACILRLLGYSLWDGQPEPTQGFSSAALAQALHYFQRMMGLECDGVIGPRTRRALVERLADRFGLRAPVPVVA